MKGRDESAKTVPLKLLTWCSIFFCPSSKPSLSFFSFLFCCCCFSFHVRCSTPTVPKLPPSCLHFSHRSLGELSRLHPALRSVATTQGVRWSDVTLSWLIAFIFLVFFVLNFPQACWWDNPWILRIQVYPKAPNSTMFRKTSCLIPSKGYQVCGFCALSLNKQEIMKCHDYSCQGTTENKGS